MSDTTDIQHYLDLIEETKRRLHSRERQKAQFGYDTPPHILNEIEQCHRDIEVYRAQLTVGPPPSEKAQNEVPGDAQQILIEAKLKEIKEENAAANTSVIETVNRIDRKVESIDVSSKAYREQEHEIRLERQQENDKHFSDLDRQVDALVNAVGRMNDRLDWVLWRVMLIVGVASVVTIIGIWMAR